MFGTRRIEVGLRILDFGLTKLLWQLPNPQVSNPTSEIHKKIKHRRGEVTSPIKKGNETQPLRKVAEPAGAYKGYASLPANIDRRRQAGTPPLKDSGVAQHDGVGWAGKCFFVAAEEIRANKYDLSISRYKQIEHKEIEYDKPVNDRS